LRRTQSFVAQTIDIQTSNHTPLTHLPSTTPTNPPPPPPQFWDERNVLEWETLSLDINNLDSFPYVFCKAAFDECVTIEATIDRIRRSRGSFAREKGAKGCDASCTSRHDGAICLVCGVGYGTHADHTCPHAIQQIRVDNMHEQRGKTPVHVRREDLLGSSLTAIGAIPDSALSKELAISFEGKRMHVSCCSRGHLTLACVLLNPWPLYHLTLGCRRGGH